MPDPEAVATADAPAAIGPYSQAVRSGEWIFVSGQIPLDPATGELVDDSIENATRRVLANVVAVLRAAGAEPRHVLRTTVYLRDLADFAAVNALYAEVFSGHGGPAPARACVQAARLPRDSRVEIDAIARLDA